MVRFGGFLLGLWVNILNLQCRLDVPSTDRVRICKSTATAGTKQTAFLCPTPHPFLPPECRHIPRVGSEEQIYHRLHLQREMKASLFVFFLRREATWKTQKSPVRPVGPVLVNLFILSPSLATFCSTVHNMGRIHSSLLCYQYLHARLSKAEVITTVKES